MRSVPMRSVNQPAGQETRYRLNSPLLFGVLKAWDPEAHINILDLTPAYPVLLDYFSNYHCRMHLPGCRDELLSLLVQDDQDREILPKKFNQLLPLHNTSSTSLNLILLWDLPNYLDKVLLSALVDYLKPYLDKHCVLHTYIHTRQRMPAQPANFRLTLEHNILVETSADWNTSSPMYYQELLHKVLSPFHVDRGMLLANGLQEYVMRIK